ncbi:MAG: hypothetical protein COA52_01100 [Hyphomicrobiales bacterium]|nr:MAG: hypothetical protein COA52_00010 [Hyphomicrobiales bacterium]PCJ96837.1 MAG: hypothetical protein COA52_01100 [Hyphomicrobiales bacterium]
MSRIHNKYKETAPDDAIYIGRGSLYGNPFVIGKDGNRDEVCDKFEKEILPHIDIEPLKGKHLICFCAPQRCHGDSILSKLKEMEKENE